MKIIALVNSAAGSDADSTHQETHRVDQALRQADLTADVRPVEGNQLHHAARQAVSQGIDALVAAGGDGTINAAAGAVAGTGVPLGILPLGTLNHFAKDLHLPLDLSQAARVIAAGHTRQVDIAQVNGQCFINNSSIGLYPNIVTHRDEQRQRLGRGKWLAMLTAALTVFRRYPLVEMRLRTDHQQLNFTTPMLFVGNNPYEMSLLDMGARPKLDGGVLSIYFTPAQSRLALLRIILRGLVGRLDQAKDFQSLTSRELWVQTHKKTLRVALDGEVKRMEPPLHYELRPKALTVFAPTE